MPQKVVIRSAAFFTAILVLAQLALIAFHVLRGEMVLPGQPALVAILTSVIALPLICYSSISAERNRETIAHLQKIAQTDALTGVLNRGAFHQAIERVEARLAPGRSAGAILYLDADGFKSINDHFGHHVGDRVLSVIGDVLERHTREADICGRVGGEEFAVLLRAANLEQALHVGERIRTAVAAEAKALRVPDLSLTISVGVAVHQAGEPLRECLLAADSRRSKAGSGGRLRQANGLTLVHND